ncbi:unnamed protein product, partial [Sphacelaria rigidula]
MQQSKKDAVAVRSSSYDGIERWIADSGVTFRMTESATFLRDVQTSEDEVKVGNNTLIDVECYGSLTVVFPDRAGRAKVKLEKVTYAPDLRVILRYGE